MTDAKTIFEGEHGTGGYSKQCAIYLADGPCTVCKKEDPLCLETDGSNGEYFNGCICRECANKAWDEAEAAAAGGVTADTITVEPPAATADTITVEPPAGFCQGSRVSVDAPAGHGTYECPYCSTNVGLSRDLQQRGLPMLSVHRAGVWP